MPADAARPVGAGAGSHTTRAVLGVAGMAAFVALWEVAGRNEWLGRTFVPLSDVADAVLSEQRRDTLLGAFVATAGSAAWGLLIGVTVALGAAMLAVATPPLKPGLDRLAAAVHALPLIAMAPLFIVTLGRDRTAAAIAAMGAGFAMFVAATSAFESARPSHHDVLTVLGSGRVKRFRSLQLPAALPGLVDGLRLAAPAAIIGAVIGEWFGAPRGLGVLIVSAMQNFQIPLLWAAALLAAMLSMIVYGLLSALAVSVGRRWGS